MSKDFKNDRNIVPVFVFLNRTFQVNTYLLHFDKTDYVQFTIKSSDQFYLFTKFAYKSTCK
jgi:hypothetical protein